MCEKEYIQRNTIGVQKGKQQGKGGKAEYIQYIIKHGFGKTVVSNNASRTIS